MIENEFEQNLPVESMPDIQEKRVSDAYAALHAAYVNFKLAGMVDEAKRVYDLCKVL